MAPIIHTVNLRKVYAVGKERVIALNDVSISIEKGEFCCIVGQSGSGKSTLLNQLAGLEKPTRGKVFIGSHEISAMTEDELAKFRQAHLGFIFQSYNLLPTMTAVNNAGGVVTVYAVDSATKKYAVPFMAMVCSGGMDTPTGYFSTPVDYSWRLLMGPSYGQYATRIYDSYLFHSVPYYSQHKDDVEYDEFNLLGTRASLGCIRLAVVDVKWIYDNCPLGTPVIIYNDADDPGPMGKPGTIYTDPTDEEMRGWDPTDPDPANPWDDHFESGTAIRSQAAWDQWESERENWQSSLTPTDLQGWSTDSKIAGTRG